MQKKTCLALPLVENNCGIGSGGFQSGNKCAGGGEGRSKNKMSAKAQTAHANLTKKGFKRVGKSGIGKWMYENSSTGQTAILGRSSGVVEFDDPAK